MKQKRPTKYERERRRAFGFRADTAALREHRRKTKGYKKHINFKIPEHFADCKHCGKTFKKKSPTQKYCNEKCKRAYYEKNNPPKAPAKLTKKELQTKYTALLRTHSMLKNKYEKLRLLYERQNNGQ